MTIDEMLQRRDEVYLEWDEPWAACGSDGEYRDAHVTLRATVADYIDLARYLLKEEQRTQSVEAELLHNVFVVHGARVVGESPNDTNNLLALKAYVGEFMDAVGDGRETRIDVIHATLSYIWDELDKQV